MKFLNLTLFVFISIVLLFSGCDKDDPVSPEENLILPTVITADITEITYNTAISGGEVTDDGGSEVTARGVVWCTSPWPTLENNKTNDGSGTGSFTSDITDLQSGTNYCVRAYATNSEGTAYGDQVLFRTIQETGTVTDIDGNEYETVKIGDQWWMAENLRTSSYRNGDEIPLGLGRAALQNTESGAYAIYPHYGGEYEDDVYGIDSDEEMVDAYGKLYNWYAVDDDRGLCPEGWRVPRDGDWTALVDYVVAQGYPNFNLADGAGNALKSRRQVNSPLGAPWATSEHPRWHSHSTHHGLDVFGFSGLPGGFKYDGKYYGIESAGYWWSSTEDATDDGYAWTRSMGFNYGAVDRFNSGKYDGIYVRCLRH